MNGAESLVHSLLKSGVDTCFANPGTSEMHFVAALDRIPGMRCVLGLFEGVVTGAVHAAPPLREPTLAPLIAGRRALGNTAKAIDRRRRRPERSRPRETRQGTPA